MVKILNAVNLTLLDTIVAVTLVAIAFFLPFFEIPQVGSLVTSATAVFAVVAGFFIADATANYLRLQTLIAEENGVLISVAHELHQISADDEKRMYDLIDGYLIEQLDVDSLDHIVTTQETFNQILDLFDEVIEKYDDVRAQMEEQRDKLITINQEMMLAANSNLTTIHWGILVSLWMVVAITVLAIRDHTLTMSVITAGMLLGCQGVLVVLRDVDNNRYLQRKLSFKNPRFVFQAINQPPYYPLDSKPKHRQPNKDGLFRMRNENNQIVTVSAK